MTDRDPGGFADIHSHLVPGVDDGARNLEDTLEAVGRMTKLGIRKILTTPHLNGSFTRNGEELEARLSEVDEAFDRAAIAVGANFPEVDFKRGHEVMLDIPDVDFSDPRVRLAGTSFVLIEWPRLRVPPGTTKVLERILSAGYRPIIAHPERYIGIDRKLAVIARWREAGAYLQVNHGSLSGRYGAAAKEIAAQLLRGGWAHYLASDFHAQSQAKIYFKEVWEQLEAMRAGESLTHLCLTNPSRLFKDEIPFPVAPLPPATGLWARVKGMMGQDPR
jgi:protein-tyrosine phosphatase